MKTAHQLARELLAGPDLPIYHFDPSRAGLDDENDTSLSVPTIERETLDPEDIEAGKARAEELGRELLTDWLNICGETDEAGEASPTSASVSERLEWLAKQPHLTPGTARYVREVADLCRANGM